MIYLVFYLPARKQANLLIYTFEVELLHTVLQLYTACIASGADLNMLGMNWIFSATSTISILR